MCSTNPGLSLLLTCTQHGAAQHVWLGNSSALMDGQLLEWHRMWLADALWLLSCPLPLLIDCIIPKSTVCTCL